MITPYSLARVKDVAIADVVSRYVKLDKHGKASCPFHNEKSASFSVNNKKGMYKCFGCGKGGDALQFIQDLNHLTFLEAAQAIAEIGGFELEQDRTIDKEAYAKAKEEKASLRALIADAQAHFLHELWNTNANYHAVQYLKEQRGYDTDTIIAWGIGFAPADTRLLTNKYGVDGRLPLAKQAGVVREGDSNLFDAFINRIIFPIHNHQGEIVSFAGRKLPGADDKSPKYINGAATEIYDKSRVLYGLYQAITGIKEAKYAIIVEGYTDVIGMHRGGATNTVATCGTALTEAHCKLLRQHTDTVVLMRDADAAGTKAISRDIPLLLQAGIKAEVFDLPERGDGGKMDPDEFSKQFITVDEDEAVPA